MSSKFLILAGLLYVGVAYGYLRNAQYPECGAWACYAIANWCFAARAYLQGN